MKHNAHEITLIKRLAKEIGVDKITLKTVTLDIDKEGSDKSIQFLPEDSSLIRYSKDEEGIKRKDEIKNSCLRLWFSSVINWDGTVVACCYDPNRIYEFGNMFKEENFKSIWNNKTYQKFRRVILLNKKGVDMCKNCSGKLMGLNIS
jgi:radical SAM protein with 4Fe4S-binding SPASM domain